MKCLSEIQTQLKEKAKPVSVNTAVFFKQSPVVMQRMISL
ncbi:hypothetical protein LDG_6607 [Legionella drancourtii LLAP12]|uniref:Uncharacterized protein n=1 Tax=Legionella drancourtii LLAP12 TaxID=658187 RepID=G9EMY7_9GAMM|nr:hypothetical protein LDG_6607 [Legionella drancourtii LLAP12]